MASIAEQIRKVRKDQGLSQAGFAKALGISTVSVSNYETGKTNPGKKVIDKIRALYGENALDAAQKEVVADKKAAQKAAPKKAAEKAAPKKPEKKAAKKVVEKAADAAPKKAAEKAADAAPKEAAPKKPAAKAAAKKASSKKAVKAEPVKQVTALSDRVEPDIVPPTEPTDLKICIQSVMGGSIQVDEIIARVHATAPDTTEIYVKPEENKAYYVGGASSGYVVLWE